SLVRAGRESSMDSPHLRKCAIVLNFFRESDEGYTLEQSLTALDPLGSYWESLDPRNRCGARRNGVLAAQRFERALGGRPPPGAPALIEARVDAPGTEAVALADDSRPAEVAFANGSAQSTTPVLRRGSQERDAVARLQTLLVKVGLLETASGTFD